MINNTLSNDLIQELKNKNMIFERAKINQLEDIINLYKERADWFKQNNIEQWGEYLKHHPKEEFYKVIKNGDYFVLKEDEKIIAGFQITTDSSFWNDSKTSAYYLYKIVSKVGYKNLGNLIIKICKFMCVRDKKEYLRLDCKTSNTKLNEIYNKYGFKLVMTGKDYYNYSLREYKVEENIELENVDFNEFKTVIYPEYIKIFPKEERKKLEEIEENYKKNITKFIEIKQGKEFVGFLMLNAISENKYILLDYFAILQKYQGKGYGSKVIKELQKKCIDYEGIIIEVEALGFGKNEEENKIRERRVSFYKRLGFEKINYKLNWYNKVVFSLYILRNSDKKEDDDEILEAIFKIYYAVLDKEKVDLHCKIIKE